MKPTLLRSSSSILLALLLLPPPALWAAPPECANEKACGVSGSCPDCPPIGQGGTGAGGAGPQVAYGMLAGANPFAANGGNVHRAITDLQVWGGVGQHALAWTRHAHSRSNPTSRETFGQAHNWRHGYQWQMASAGTELMQ